jgi:hypothetical protein
MKSNQECPKLEQPCFYSFHPHTQSMSPIWRGIAFCSTSVDIMLYFNRFSSFPRIKSNCSQLWSRPPSILLDISVGAVGYVSVECVPEILGPQLPMNEAECASVSIERLSLAYRGTVCMYLTPVYNKFIRQPVAKRSLPCKGYLYGLEAQSSSQFARASIELCGMYAANYM